MKYPSQILYGSKYSDEKYEYRNVVLTKDMFKKIPRG